MYMMGLLAVLLGLTAMLMNMSSVPKTVFAAQNAEAEAANFVTYRNAVFEYVENNPSYVGTIPYASLPLPYGYQEIVAWSNQVQSGGTVLVWGPLPAGATSAALVAGAGSTTIGVATMQGLNEVILVPGSSSSITITTGIVPVGNVASSVTIK